MLTYIAVCASIRANDAVVLVAALTLASASGGNAVEF